MEQVETCFICRATDNARNLCICFVRSERRAVNLACWITTYQASPEGQRLGDPRGPKRGRR